jgi:hypothetical protein
MDPGNQGAGALLSLDGTEIDWFKIPTKYEFPGTSKKARITDGKALYDKLNEYNIFLCAIERQAFKNAKLIQNYGICKGVLDVIQVPTLIPTPSAWMYELKRYLDLGHLKNKNKEFTFAAFKDVYPGIKLPRNDDNIADAALLAYYGYLMLQKAEELDNLN